MHLDPKNSMVKPCGLLNITGIKDRFEDCMWFHTMSIGTNYNLPPIHRV